MKKMTKGCLVFIGLGLYDETDVSMKGVEELKHCDEVFAEFYTTKLGRFDRQSFEQLIGKKITVLTRQETEKGDRIIDAATHNSVAFLTGGDPMIATTHVDLRLRAMKQNISTRIIHGGSITTAVPGLLGLQNYKFGRTTTLAFAEKDRYMTANEGLNLLIKMEEKLKKHLIVDDTIACVVARAGAPDEMVVADTIQKLRKRDFGPPLHPLVITGNLHFMEIEAL